MKWLYITLILSASAFAQQSLNNTPSADIVEKGRFFTQGQSNYQPNPAFFTHAQSLAYGLGHGLEIDVDGYNVTRASQAAGGPGFKWAPYAKGKWQTFVGDLTMFGQGGGNLFYMGAARRVGTDRVTASVWNSQAFYAGGNRTGISVGYEHAVGQRFQPQIDWYSGAFGQTAAAVQINFTKNFAIAPGYQWGNTGITQGNHSALVQVDWTF